MTDSDRVRIQAFADRHGLVVHVVGSHAANTDHDQSDFDYILGDRSSSRQRRAARLELPRGKAGGEIHPRRGETGIDVFKTSLDSSKPHLTFYPA